MSSDPGILQTSLFHCHLPPSMDPERERERGRERKFNCTKLYVSLYYKVSGFVNDIFLML